MGTITERIQKLTQELDKVEQNRTKWNNRYTEITQEIVSIITNTTVTAAKTAMNKPTTPVTKPKSGELSQKILTTITKNPGETLHDLVKRLKIRPAKVGVALYHLKNKGYVTDNENGQFYPVELVAAAAKSVPSDSELEADIE